MATVTRSGMALTRVYAIITFTFAVYGSQYSLHVNFTFTSIKVIFTIMRIVTSEKIIKSSWTVLGSVTSTVLDFALTLLVALR